MTNPWQSRKPAAPRPPRESAAPRAPRAPRDDAYASADEGAERSYTGGSRKEIRLYGVNAINAVFATRPEAIRKVYLVESRLPDLKALLSWCSENKVGYRIVDDADLQRLAQSQHHEGVVAEVLRREDPDLQEWLDTLPAGPQCAVWLDGVGNPHNFGAILRSCAHFDVGAVLIRSRDPLAMNGASARVAEGGAEAVKIIRLPERELDGLTLLRRNGFKTFATTVSNGLDVFSVPMPERVIWVLGAEGEGMDRQLASLCDAQVSIPGSGLVESLNVASATAVFLSQWAARSAR